MDDHEDISRVDSYLQQTCDRIKDEIKIKAIINDLMGNEVSSSTSSSSTLLTKVHFIGRRIGDRGLKVLSSALSNCSTNVDEAEEGDNTDDSRQSSSSSCNNNVVTTLCVIYADVTSVGVRSLANVLNYTSITDLNLSGNNLSDNGATIIGRSVLQHTNNNLRCLILARCSIGNNGMIELTKGIEKYHHHHHDESYICRVVGGLQCLDVSGNNIGDDGVIAFGNMLRVTDDIRMGANLIKIDLSENYITDKGMIEGIVYGLEMNRTVRRFYIQSNLIGDSGVIAFSNMLSTRNQTLVDVYIQDNKDVTHEIGTKALADVMESNCSLLSYKILRNNDIINKSNTDASSLVVIEEKVNFYLQLNLQTCRKLFLSLPHNNHKNKNNDDDDDDEKIPTSLWSNILLKFIKEERFSFAYYYLRCKPELWRTLASKTTSSSSSCRIQRRKRLGGRRNFFSETEKPVKKSKKKMRVSKSNR